MRRVLHNPIFRFFADLRLAAVILAIFAVASGVGTWVEAHYSNLGSLDFGRAAVFELVYDAPWFNALLVLLFVNLLTNLIQRLLRGRRPAGFLLVHVGMLLILAGAGVTRWWGYEGTLRIREGQSNNMAASSDAYAVVKLGQEEAALPVRLFRPGPQLHRTDVVLDGETFTLGVSEFWPRFERRLEPGPGGAARVVLAGGPSGMEPLPLFAGDYARIGRTVVRFFEGDWPTAPGRHGDLHVQLANETCRLAIESDTGRIGECGGWVFDLIEYQGDFRMGELAGDDSRMGRSASRGTQQLPRTDGREAASNAKPVDDLRMGPLLSNPMVRIEVTSPAGERVEKRLFARHPDPQTLEADLAVLSQIDLSYEHGNTFDLVKRGDTVVMRASFPFRIRSAPEDGTAEASAREVAAGDAVPAETGQWILGPEGFETRVHDVAPSLVWGGVGSTDPNAPAAARVFVALQGEQAEAVCVRGDEAQTVVLGGRQIELRYGSVFSKLPYDVFLEDFVLQTYPGSDNPASYESHVLLTDRERGITDRPVRIWMNHPMNHRGTKHFQSSYDPDRLGTILAINRDPGKTTTYIGYTVISLGFLVVVLRLIHRRVVDLRALSKVAAVLAVCIGSATSSTAGFAQTDGTGSIHDAPDPTRGPPAFALSEENLHLASRLIVQDFRGRMKPLDTLARETVIKITKSRRFEGREPVEIFLGLPLHPEAWYAHPMIRAKNPGVRQLLGVDASARHVPLSRVLRDDGYVLQNVVEEAHRTPSNRRDKTQQKLIVFDERVHLLFGALQGNPLRIFPIPDDPEDTWQSIEKVLEVMPAGDPRVGEFKVAAGTLFEGLLAGNDEQTSDGLRLVHELQQRYGAVVVPTPLRVDSELTLNRVRPFVTSVAPYLVGFVLLISAYFVGLLSQRGGVWSWKNPLYAIGMSAFLAGFGIHLWGFVLRWIASSRGPLSNGHESLLWVALTVAFAGVLFEWISRTAAVGALSSLLTAVVLGVSMLGTFDPSIGPLMPVLSSYWLNIHVTVITASYGFLGLCCLLGLLTLVLFLVNWRQHRPGVVRAIGILDQLNVDVMIFGIGLLTVGTLLGGVWANESWGRYWGWDPKETWALVSILLYAMILHFRWIPKLANPFVQAVSSFLAIWSIIMTYFGVNYLLMGMHSYAAGDKVAIPMWASVSVLASILFGVIAYQAWSRQPSMHRRSREPAKAFDDPTAGSVRN